MHDLLTIEHVCRKLDALDPAAVRDTIRKHFPLTPENELKVIQIAPVMARSLSIYLRKRTRPQLSPLAFAAACEEIGLDLADLVMSGDTPDRTKDLAFEHRHVIKVFGYFIALYLTGEGEFSQRVGQMLTPESWDKSSTTSRP